MLSLLFAQWLGYTHAVAHAGLVSEALVAELPTDGTLNHSQAAGSCAAFDAATLGAGMHSDVPALVVVRQGVARCAPLAPASAPSRFLARFSSRAPPLTA